MPFIRNHVVICGLGRKGMDLARCFRRQGKRIFAIEKAPSEAVGRECARLHITLLAGTSADVVRLKAAGAARAVIAVGGDDNGNVETALQLQALLSQQPKSSASALVCNNRKGGRPNERCRRELASAEVVSRPSGAITRAPWTASGSRVKVVRGTFRLARRGEVG